MKTIIITGANGNLGAVVTKKFLSLGCQVIATVVNEEAGRELADHDRLHVHIVNLTNEEETSRFVQKSIEKFGPLDAALMLVGGFASGNINTTSGADLAKQYSLNFETAYFIARPLFQHMVSKGAGRLVFIGARPALNPAAGKDLLAYALAKSLLFNLAEFLNEDARGKNVVTTVVVPSTIDGAVNRKNIPQADPADWVKPEQLADIFEFIVSDKGSALRETVLKVYNNA